MRKIFTLMLSLLALCLPAAAQTAQPDVTLTFKGATNDSQISNITAFKNNMSAGQDFVESLSGTPTQLYASKSNGGLKVGSGSNFGKVIINVSASYNTKVLDKITVNAVSYNKDQTYLQVNGVQTALLNKNADGYADYELTGFKDEPLSQLSIETVTNKKAAVIRSISIYFKPDKEPVEQPVINCEGNTVTITCGTEGASIVYSTDGSEPSIPYTKAFPITETCTVKAKASKEGMAESTAEKLCEYVAPAVKPSKPVVSVEGDVKAEEEFSVDYGAVISVSSENATSMVVAYGNEDVPVEGNSYEFEATANETYMVTPVNDKMPEGEKKGEAAKFTVAINAPEILSVMNGDEAIEKFGSIVAKAGTEITVTAKSYAEIAVENEGLAVDVTDGKFVIGNEKSYIITVSNPACEEKAEMMFSVTHPEETEYEANETLNWEFTGVATWSKDNNGMCDTDINNDENSASGIWHAYKEGVCNAGSYNGANFGSGATSSFKNGTVTLTESNIPENAKITSVSLKGIPVKSAGTVVKWGVSVNGANAEGTLDFPADGSNYSKSSHLTKTISNLNLTGNQIVFTMLESTDQKGFYLSGISVSYQVLA